MSSKSLWSVSSLVILTSLLTACQEPEAPAPESRPPQQVGVVSVKSQAYALTNDLPGRTAAYRVAEVRPQVNGLIEKRLFVEGSEVKKGQQLYQIDASVYDATYKSAQASLAASESLAKRYADLVKDQAVSKQAYADANAAYLQAKASVERAAIDLRYTKVLAPISGRIGRSAVTEGALVTSGQAQPLATIQQLDPIYVDVTQPARDLLILRRDMAEGRLEKASENAAKVSLTLEDGTQFANQGTLEFSEVAVDASTGSVTLRAVFPNPEKELLPGMFVHAKLVAGVKQQAILAPQQGVTRNARGEPIAMVVGEGNVVEVRTLKTERAEGNMWLVTDGLKDGDQLITEGLQFIQPGVVVDPQPAGNVSAKAAGQ